jgi:endonuclease/exonuclease/phosphatase family metal-dependent hydrolase
MLSSGAKLLGSKEDGSSPRYLAWAVLRQRSTGTKFFFADSHLEDDKDLYALRKSEAEVAVQTIRERNPDGLPVIAVGDFNSSRFSDPTNAPYDAYIQGGFSDPIGNAYDSTQAVNATAERSISTWLNSFNGFVRHAKGHRSWDNGSYLDYMLTSPMRVSEWETVARLDVNDDFVGIIPSDHNMIRMTVYLPR